MNTFISPKPYSSIFRLVVEGGWQHLSAPQFPPCYPSAVLSLVTFSTSFFSLLCIVNFNAVKLKTDWCCNIFPGFSLVHSVLGHGPYENLVRRFHSELWVHHIMRYTSKDGDV